MRLLRILGLWSLVILAYLFMLVLPLLKMCLIVYTAIVEQRWITAACWMAAILFFVWMFVSCWMETNDDEQQTA